MDYLPKQGSSYISFNRNLFIQIYFLLARRQYYKNDPFTVILLGLTIDNSEKHHVIFAMYDYLKDFLEEVPKDIYYEARTPAKDALFTVDHSSLLFLKRERQIQRTNSRQ